MKTEYPLLHGERPIENAPAIQLDNGGLCIPQHFLHYDHSLLSVEKIILDIDYNDRYLIFVSADQTGIYIQIGIIGFDNYIPRTAQTGQKVVYGRKWRVEPQLPTSEIIQTVFLAVKKAREHEVRELFRLTRGRTYTTPFNNHHDLPLMSQNADLVRVTSPFPDEDTGFQSLKSQLGHIRYDNAQINLKAVEERPNGKWLIDVAIEPRPEGQLPEITEMEISFLLPTLSIDALFYQLMDEFLTLSDRHVDENFHYKGFARFSRKNSIMAIAELSSVLRQSGRGEKDNVFAQAFQTSVHETDKTRVPILGQGLLSEKIRDKLARHGQLDGLLPEKP